MITKECDLVEYENASGDEVDRRRRRGYSAERTPIERLRKIDSRKERQDRQSLEQVSDLESAEKVVVCALFRFVEKRFGARRPMENDRNVVDLTLVI